MTKSNELTVEFDVKPEHSAASMGSGLLDVLSTPTLVGFMEYTAREIMMSDIDDSQSQVGIEMNMKHLAPTAIGKKIHVTAKLIDQHKTVYTFEVNAYDENNHIGQATHKRAIVDKAKFMAQLQ